MSDRQRQRVIDKDKDWQTDKDWLTGKGWLTDKDWQRPKKVGGGVGGLSKSLVKPWA